MEPLFVSKAVEYTGCGGVGNRTHPARDTGILRPVPHQRQHPSAHWLSMATDREGQRSAYRWLERASGIVGLPCSSDGYPDRPFALHPPPHGNTDGGPANLDGYPLNHWHPSSLLSVPLTLAIRGHVLTCLSPAANLQGETGNGQSVSSVALASVPTPGRSPFLDSNYRTLPGRRDASYGKSLANYWSKRVGVCDG